VFAVPVTPEEWKALAHCKSLTILGPAFFSVSFASDSGSSISVIGSAAAAARFFSSDGGGSSGCFCFSTAFSGAGLEPFVPLASSVAFEGRAKSFEPPYIRPKFLLLFIHQ